MFNKPKDLKVLQPTEDDVFFFLVLKVIKSTKSDLRSHWHAYTASSFVHRLPTATLFPLICFLFHLGLCCCLLETELSRAHFCSDSCINHRLRLLGRQSVFSQHRLQVFVYPAVCRTPFKPWCAYLPACCKTTYTIPGIPPKASFGTPFPSPHLPLFLLTRTPPPLFPKNQTIVPPSWLTLHHLFL